MVSSTWLAHFFLREITTMLMSIRPSLGDSEFGVMSVMRIPKKLSLADPMTPQSFGMQSGGSRPAADIC